MALSSMVGLYLIQLTPGLLTMPIFNAAINNINGHELGLLSAGYPLGGVLSFQGAAWFSDRYGRKKAIAVGALITIAAALVQGLTKGHWALFGGRMFLGIGSAFEVVAAPTLIAEICHPRTRAQASSITQTCYYIGAIVAAWVTFGTLKIQNDWCWRIPIVGGCLTLLIVATASTGAHIPAFATLVDTRVASMARQRRQT